MNYSFQNFQKNAIIRFLALDKYNYIKDNLYKCDVSKDNEFQTRFNAFYRVDKSRNRKTGGTGLWLYIVKTILDKHENISYKILCKENSVVFKMMFKK